MSKGDPTGIGDLDDAALGAGKQPGL